MRSSPTASTRWARSAAPAHRRQGRRLSTSSQCRLRSSAKSCAPAKTDEPPAPKALIIKTPIRSGQSVFHPHGDVIVLGSVGSGSEIIAGGSIHVYGTLRGRAFAGAPGNAEARIFCRKNEAELLAVDGWYRTAEDMEPSSRGKPIQAFLDNGTSASRRSTNDKSETGIWAR